MTALNSSSVCSLLRSSSRPDRSHPRDVRQAHQQSDRQGRPRQAAEGHLESADEIGDAIESWTNRTYRPGGRALSRKSPVLSTTARERGFDRLEGRHRPARNEASRVVSSRGCPGPPPERTGRSTIRVSSAARWRRKATRRPPAVPRGWWTALEHEGFVSPTGCLRERRPG
jgi:hypothetical protein